MNFLRITLIESKLFANKSLLNSMNNLMKTFSSNDSSDLTQNNEKTNENKIENKSKDNQKSTKELPKPPESCCQSGCDNCVWIKYAEELEEYFGDGGLEAHKQLDRLITDPILKQFIKLQIQIEKEYKDN